jgi:thioredoxin-like negative regulator of GroEL
MATEYENAEFVMVDAEKFPESRKMANVDNLPTFAAFKNGQLVKQIQTNKVDVLKEFVDEVTAN